MRVERVIRSEEGTQLIRGRAIKNVLKKVQQRAPLSQREEHFFFQNGTILHSHFFLNVRERVGETLRPIAYQLGATWFAHSVFKEADLRGDKPPKFDDNTIEFYMVDLCRTEKESETLSRIVRDVERISAGDLPLSAAITRTDEQEGDMNALSI